MSDDGRHLGFVVRTPQGKQLVVIDGREGPAYDAVWAPVFSPGGDHAAYLARQGDRSLIVLDGAEVASYDWVGSPAFEPGTGRLAFAAKRGDQGFLVLGGREGPQHPAPVPARSSAPAGASRTSPAWPTGGSRSSSTGSPASPSSPSSSERSGSAPTAGGSRTPPRCPRVS